MPNNDYSLEALLEIQDGCSGGVTWFYKKFLGRDIRFRYCCDEHDVAYYEGGSSKDRRIADKRFRQCIAERGHTVKSWIFYSAVRAFGWLYWNST